MRPLELRLRNFRSYFGAEAVFDLRDRSLVGVVGPIGSGKSSLLDAVAFALYGRTPAGGAATTALIHQRAENGAVQLRFEVDGEIWEVVRSLRRKGQSQHALYRFADDSAGEDPVERVTQERPVNDRIKALLGLDFDAFGRSVLLAQGRFAEFLSAGAAARDRVLKGVFGHDRIDQIREVARNHGAGIAAELALIEAHLELVDRIQARLATTVADLEEIEGRLELLMKAEPTVADLDAAIAAAAAQADQARRRLVATAPLGERLPTPEAVSALVGEEAAVRGRRRQLAADMERAEDDRVSAEAAVGELERGGEKETLVQASRRHAELSQQFRALETAVGELDELSRRIDTQQRLRLATAEALAASVTAQQGATEALASADDAVGRARSDRHAASHRNMAADLRHSLAVGDDCPVCLRTIEDLPAAAPPPDLEAAEAAVAAAESARRAAERFRGEAAGVTAGLEAKLAAIDQGVSELEATRARREGDVEARRSDVDRGSAELAALLGEGDPELLIDQRRTRIARLEQAADRARHRLDTVRGEHDAVIRREQEVDRRVAQMRRDLDRVADQLAMESLEGGLADGDGMAQVAASIERVRQAWTDQRAAATATAAEADVALGAATGERADLMGRLGVSGDFAVEVATVKADAAHLASAVAADRAEIDRAAGMTEQRATLTARRRRLDRIVHDLTDARFVRYLLDEERARLADLGSDHFMRLTSGRYRFTEDGEFSIVDLTAADAVRKASSLSGGETFLASLALALALAEMVTRTGGRLDAFFIDEGFGSLDPEHLDLAMEGIEALVADGSSRLVVVVSHVPELRERIEDIIQLDRDPATGDTRVVRA